MVIERILAGMIGTNCYLIWDESTLEAAVIDPAQDLPEISDTILREKLILKYILLTHGHGDHIGGVEAIMDQNPDTKLVAGKAESTLLTDSRLNISREITGRSIVLHPDIFVSQGDTLFLGEQKLEIIETPGHTPGGISILAGEALFSGDTLFRTSIGRTDLPLGSYEDLMDSIREKLYVLPDDTLVFPGHMDETTIGFEKKHNPFV
ncbi:MAG: MBL fold metallo-hydrolase [Clostridiales Family XIII bacterium]|jgi:glyoxylase-like metal-dependent hydrolase (beta-lactamase superfamily II)|nr:MBL fold metallo-hydrolase [Clostridiales Family XIII bacterium]